MKAVSEIETLPGAKIINSELLEHPHLLIKIHSLKSSITPIFWEKMEHNPLVVLIAPIGRDTMFTISLLYNA